MRAVLRAALAAVLGWSFWLGGATAQTDDHLVVPGQRIGAVRLGMTEAELYRAMGDPASTTDLGRGWVWYEYNQQGQPGMTVTVDPQRQVSQISVQTRGYRTPDGVAVGGSQLSARALIGLPAKVESGKGQPPSYAWCYPNGLMVGVYRGQISALTVISTDRSLLPCS